MIVLPVELAQWLGIVASWDEALSGIEVVLFW